MTPRADTISEEEFHTAWGVKTNESGDLFTFQEVKDQPLNQVWSIIECEDDSWIASPGFHMVNVLGYVMTEKPWTDPVRDAAYA